jgi:hypothetical protein
MTDLYHKHRLAHDPDKSYKNVKHKANTIPDRMIARKKALACHESGFDHSIEVCINVSVLHTVVRIQNGNLLIVGKNELI